jgi:hypothetical protein
LPSQASQLPQWIFGASISFSIPPPKRQKPAFQGGLQVSDLVGRGNLNTAFIVLIFMINVYFDFWLEYQLEYRAKLNSI